MVFILSMMDRINKEPEEVANKSLNKNIFILGITVFSCILLLFIMIFMNVDIKNHIIGTLFKSPLVQLCLILAIYII